jgi:hypothetical protein
MNEVDPPERSGLQMDRRLGHPHIRRRGVYSGDSSIPTPPFHGGPSARPVNAIHSSITETPHPLHRFWLAGWLDDFDGDLITEEVSR